METRNIARMENFTEYTPYSLNLRRDYMSYSWDAGYCLDAPEWIARGGHYCDGDKHGIVQCGFNRRESPWYVKRAPGDRLAQPATPAPAPKRGGKRAGAGRPALDAQGTLVVSLRLTGQQKATFDMLGGKEWLRGQLDLFASP